MDPQEKNQNTAVEEHHKAKMTAVVAAVEISWNFENDESSYQASSEIGERK